jgi:hypothetical protein
MDDHRPSLRVLLLHPAPSPAACNKVRAELVCRARSAAPPGPSPWPASHVTLFCDIRTLAIPFNRDPSEWVAVQLAVYRPGQGSAHWTGCMTKLLSPSHLWGRCPQRVQRSSAGPALGRSENCLADDLAIGQ